MSKEQNLATQDRLRTSLSAGDIDDAVTAFSVDSVDHNPAPGQGPGREGYKQFFTELGTAFPDIKVEPVHVVADDEYVSMAYTITGTHDGPFNGIEPTGKRIEISAVQIGRFENGEIVERWGSTDELGIMQQIGAVPAA